MTQFATFYVTGWTAQGGGFANRFAGGGFGGGGFAGGDCFGGGGARFGGFRR